MTETDTIFALSSGQGRAGVAVIRVSGPAAGDAVATLSARPPGPARAMTLRTLRDAKGNNLDNAMVVWFPAPNSFTGEDVAEFHVHGGRAVVSAVLDALSRDAGCVPAEAGAFTRRAFDNGKLDLTQVEGLADLVDAETEGQRRQALRQMDGALGVLYEGWRERLVRALAYLEADIDFPDEDLPGGLPDAVRGDLDGLVDEMRAHLDDAGLGERTRGGFRAVIVGAPNVGKSSLLNKLAKRDAAIVAATAGTTRDVVEVQLDVAGLPVTLADTAGLREAGDGVEREGVRRAQAQADRADIKIAVFDAQTWPTRDAATAKQIDARTIVVVNKADLAGPPDVHADAVVVSAATGAGMDDLVAALRARIAVLAGEESETPPLTRVRHRRAVEEAVAAVGRALDAAAAELRAEEMRQAALALGRITGRVDIEDLLDVIFRDFCIGK